MSSFLPSSFLSCGCAVETASIRQTSTNPVKRYMRGLRFRERFATNLARPRELTSLADFPWSILPAALSCRNGPQEKETDEETQTQGHQAEEGEQTQKGRQKE